MKKTLDENIKHFKDHSLRSWVAEDDDNIKVGDSFKDIMSDNYDVIEVKEVIYGEPARSWRLVIAKDDSVHLLKTSRELK
jgi:hypothetical protein